MYPGPPNPTPNTKEKEKEKTEVVPERKKSLTKEKTLMPIRRRSKTFVITKHSNYFTIINYKILKFSFNFSLKKQS